MDIWTLGPPGQVQDHQEHHRNDQEQPQDLQDTLNDLQYHLQGLQGPIRIVYTPYSMNSLFISKILTF